MTYKNCKKIIENTIRKKDTNVITAKEYKAFKSDMTTKLDVFLLNGRINETEYNELIGLM